MSEYRAVVKAGMVPRAREFFWRRVMRWETEICTECGGRVRIIWTAPDSRWHELVGNRSALLCAFCFDRLAESRGEIIRWVPHPIEYLPAHPPDRPPEAE